ncbi:uncharacterized protein zgc:193505 [Trichomycterus rosablanca]|uniref:uncharacterized protein zgc:193505 n=1 Tax=Trichomycterus rosablanca TaxID=2290929 RepID=UPI002F35A320
MSLNHFVDAAVDQAARAAKTKVKSLMGGKNPGTSGGMGGKNPGTSGGIGGLFSSAGQGGKAEKGGLFGGLLAAAGQGTNPGAPGGAPAGAPAGGAYGGAAGGAVAGPEGADFNAALDELAGL